MCIPSVLGLFVSYEIAGLNLLTIDVFFVLKCLFPSL